MSIEENIPNEEVAVRVNGVSKSFKLPHEQHDGLKQSVTSVFSRKRSHGYEIQHALRGVSFEVRKGDFFGIVGRNGSGKSTLLKILSGIYTPDSGSVKVNGSLVPFIELGVGFNPELTGRENVYLNGALLGFTRKQISAMYDEIVSFAELGKFMDQKLKNYSSGMQVRLAFSIAIRAKSDVLVLDEVLAVGDEAFQRKCYQHFAELKKEKKTVILVTHSMDAVQQFCNRAILIDKGHETEIGTPHKIAQLYQELNDTEGVTVSRSRTGIKTSTKYVAVQMQHELIDKKHIFDIMLQPKESIEDPILAMGIYQDDGDQVYRWTSDEKIPHQIDLETHRRIRIEVADILPVGVFAVNLYIKKRDRTVDYAVFNEIIKFEVKNVTKHRHAVYWRIPEETFVNEKGVGNV
jgi:ABC-2 type transport system ATP-binding protein